MAYIGGLRARLVHDSIFRSLYDGLDALGWFTPSTTHSPVTFLSEPLAPDVEVPFNTLGLADADDSGEDIELGSSLQELRWQMYVDFFGENDAISLHLIRDVKDILEGRMPSIGLSRPTVDVYDYTLATPAAIFTVDIEDVFTDKARDFPQPWLRAWRSCGFTVVDTYDNDEGVDPTPSPTPMPTPTPESTSGSYTHVQMTPSAVWTINHGLSYRPAGIIVEDTAGSTIEGDVAYPSTGVVVLTFSAAFAGTAYLS